MRATGTFEVKLSPLDAHEPLIGRRSIDKTYTGELDAVGRGEMLAVMDLALGSGAYVALERVVGTLSGRTGSFALVHRGLMNRGRQSLVIEVAPDSGDGDLKGLTGQLEIIIEAGRHAYAFDYELP
ncbi:MAG TPA: DUF3224 domain-containing protein [Caulobacterales bacterium]|nr:DUF3224 domain-containing protein [Caulobacterales bacterium]